MEADNELPGAAPAENAGFAVALSETACGEPGASSEIIKLAARWPEASGLKTRETVQLAADASEPAQLLVKLNSEAFDPLTPTEENCSGAFPELVRVRVCAALEDPCVVAGNDGVAGEKVRAGTTAIPVPLKTRVCGEPEASSATIKFARRWPGAVGLKTREMVQLEPGATGALQLLVKLKSDGLEPARETEDTWSGAVPVLMTVRV